VAFFSGEGTMYALSGNHGKFSRVHLREYRMNTLPYNTLNLNANWMVESLVVKQLASYDEAKGPRLWIPT